MIRFSYSRPLEWSQYFSHIPFIDKVFECNNPVYEIRLLHFSSVQGLRKYIRQMVGMTTQEASNSLATNLFLPVSYGLSAIPKQFSLANVVTWGTLQAKWLKTAVGHYTDVRWSGKCNTSSQIWRRSVRWTLFCCPRLVKLSCTFTRVQGHEALEEERVHSTTHSWRQHWMEISLQFFTPVSLTPRGSHWYQWIGQWGISRGGTGTV